MLGDLLNVARALEVSVTTALLPDDLLGCYIHDARGIMLDARLTPNEMRVVLAHEVGHAHYGHSCLSGRDEVNPAHEARADRFAARLLIEGAELARLEQVVTSLDQLADELGVTVEFLRWYRDHYLTKLSDSTYAGAREGIGQFDHRHLRDELVA